MVKYNLYECTLDTIPDGARYTHYENGRCLIFTPRKPNHSGWRRIKTSEIKSKLTDHERAWFNKSRNEVNAEYLCKPNVQLGLQEHISEVLDRFEKELKSLTERQNEIKNAENAERNAENGE